MAPILLAVPVTVVVAVGEAVSAPGWLPSTAGAAVALIGVYAGYRQSTRVARINARSEAQKVEAGAFERARASMESEASRRDGELARVGAKLAAEEEKSDRLRARVLELEERVALMRRRMIVAGIEDTE